jgi:HdeA/HdeB family protein
MRTKSTLTLCVSVALLLLASVAGPSQAPAAQSAPPAKQSAIPKSYDLNKLTCRDLLAADLLDRSSAIMFLWGFEAGRQMSPAGRP